ncbi:LOB domain-containing protein 38 [Camellia lanceoleosa]|uniref:LOB domain-containing protein 38 n=1 Tax=Camellia lanceoleosa TaxID=1840588 RepID=A0ACC0J4H8_9ERIC|nr:LOB domain-containing protein 38 [Camellia lanceoleosa]
MSCNGCRVLRKGCSENCILRSCLQSIDSPDSQAHATLFVAKFFGRAGLMSFISSVPPNQRPDLFQSLLFEACGRTVNPVNGAVGLLWTGNWHVCQAAVQTVLRGGTLRPIPEFLADETSEAEVTCTDMFKLNQDPEPKSRSNDQLGNLRLSLTPCSSSRGGGTGGALNFQSSPKKRRPGTPSMNSEESVTTTCFQSGGFRDAFAQRRGGGKLLNLFN